MLQAIHIVRQADVYGRGVLPSFTLSLPAHYRGADWRFVEVAGRALFVLSCPAPWMRPKAIHADYQLI